MRRTHAAVQVAMVLMAGQVDRHWGYDLMKRAHVRSGVLYPLLQRMLEQGWLTDGWEDPADTGGRRPPRRYYELTDKGRRELGAITADAEVDPRFVPLLGWAKRV